MYPKTEFFLDRIFPHSYWIRRDTKYISVFSPNAGKYGPAKTPYLDTFHGVNLFKWLKNNQMKANADMYHLIVTRDTDVTAIIGEFDAKNSRVEKFLGVKLDTELSFENHVSSLCKKASQRLHALARVANFMDLANVRV